MPIYMDLHVSQGITPEEIARAHQLDLEVQDEVGCKCLTYWLDKMSGSAFCLIEAPDENGVVELHNRSHKQLPAEVIKVDERVVKAFLGRIKDPEIVDFMIDEWIPVFDDSAFRILMKVQLMEVLEVFPGNTTMKPFSTSSELIGVLSKLIRGNGGNIVELTEDYCVYSFKKADDVFSALNQVSDTILFSDRSDLFKIAVAGGVPVDASGSFFGETLNHCDAVLHFLKSSGIYIDQSVFSRSGREWSKKDKVEIFALTHREAQFVKDLYGTLKQEGLNAGFNVKMLLKYMSFSQSQMYRQCVKLTGLSPNALLRKYRLTSSLKLLRSAELSIAEIAYTTGFNNPNYFSKCFKEHYGLSPLEYRELRSTGSK